MYEARKIELQNCYFPVPLARGTCFVYWHYQVPMRNYEMMSWYLWNPQFIGHLAYHSRGWYNRLCSKLTWRFIREIACSLHTLRQVPANPTPENGAWLVLRSYHVNSCTEFYNPSTELYNELRFGILRKRIFIKSEQDFVEVLKPFNLQIIYKIRLQLVARCLSSAAMCSTNLIPAL